MTLNIEQSSLPSELARSLHRQLLRIRRAEEALAQRYRQQEMRTPTHFGIGQEATAAGVCAALTDSDVAYSHHRSHNHYLAKGGSVYRLAAELFGRVTGCSKGRGGSVHLTNRETGFIASSAILGESLAAATGSALSFKMDNLDRISVAFFGDAAAEEGSFYECLNLASIRKLPLLMVCENNGYATESPLSVRQPPGTSLCERVAAFKIATSEIDGNDVAAVYAAAKEAVAHLRAGEGPYFLECETYRWLEHVGPFFDYELDRTYRSREELDRWIEKCPLQRSRDRLARCGIASEAEMDAWDSEIVAEIEADIARAYDDPWPESATLFENVT